MALENPREEEEMAPENSWSIQQFQAEYLGTNIMASALTHSLPLGDLCPFLVPEIRGFGAHSGGDTDDRIPEGGLQGVL